MNEDIFEIAGYASLFGVTDLTGDVVEPGAFTRSLALRGAAGVRMLFQHDPAQPIGAWSRIEEDRRGLRVEGRLSTGVAKAREIAALLRDGGLDGLSIGFRTVRAVRDRGRRVRRLIEADLWEISIVTFPMLPGARAAPAAAQRTPAANTVAATLRDAAERLSRKEAA